MIMKIAFPDELTLIRYAFADEDLVYHFEEESEGDLSKIENSIYMGWAGRSDDITINGELLTLTFHVSRTAENGTYPITVIFENAEGYEDTPTNSSAELLEILISNGEVIISDFLVGDMDGDGRITSADATLLARWLAGHDVEINLRAANITCSDNELPTVQDLTRLVRALVGDFPLCPHDGCEKCDP